MTKINIKFLMYSILIMQVIGAAEKSEAEKSKIKPFSFSKLKIQVAESAERKSDTNGSISGKTVKFSEIGLVRAAEKFQRGLFENNIEMVEDGIRGGIDINARGLIYGISPLIYAISNDWLPMVKLFLDAGANINDGQGLYGKTALMFAIDLHKENTERIIDILYKAGGGLLQGNVQRKK